MSSALIRAFDRILYRLPTQPAPQDPNAILAVDRDHPELCPKCGHEAVPDPKPYMIYICCRCFAWFTRWPVLARILPGAGIVCSDHDTWRPQP